MVDERNHAVVVGDDLAQLGFALYRPVAHLVDFGVAVTGNAFDDGTMQPRTTFEITLPMRWQIDVFRPVQMAPGFRRVKGVVWVGKRSPQAEGRVVVLVLSQEIDGAIPHPGRVVPGHRQR